MRRKVGWALISVGLAGAIMAMTLTPGVATPPSGLALVPLARGSNASNGTIPLKAGTDVALAQITVDPGGSSGWHSHRGGAIVVVQQGSLTVYVSVGDECRVHTYSAGQAFVERPDQVNQVINTGTVPYVLVVTFPRVPAGAPDENRRAGPWDVSRSLTIRPSATPRTWGVALAQDPYRIGRLRRESASIVTAPRSTRAVTMNWVDASKPTRPMPL